MPDYYIDRREVVPERQRIPRATVIDDLPAYKDQADGATMLLFNLIYRRGLTIEDFAAQGVIDPRAAGKERLNR